MTDAWRQKAHRRGIWAEKLAVLYLFLKGYRILATRYKTPVGEADIIASKNNSLVVVEVKSRVRESYALESVRPQNCARIEQALKHFLMKNPRYNNHGVRFDVIAMRFPFFVRHLDNAWEARS